MLRRSGYSAGNEDMLAVFLAESGVLNNAHLEMAEHPREWPGAECFEEAELEAIWALKGLRPERSRWLACKTHRLTCICVWVQVASEESNPCTCPQQCGGDAASQHTGPGKDASAGFQARQPAEWHSRGQGQIFKGSRAGCNPGLNQKVHPKSSQRHQEVVCLCRCVANVCTSLPYFCHCRADTWDPELKRYFPPPLELLLAFAMDFRSPVTLKN